MAKTMLRRHTSAFKKLLEKRGITNPKEIQQLEDKLRHLSKVARKKKHIKKVVLKQRNRNRKRRAEQIKRNSKPFTPKHQKQEAPGAQTPGAQVTCSSSPYYA
jgi:hypothetical protein